MISLPQGTIDETGHRYGRLLVLDYAGREELSGDARWRCRCDCGTIRTVRGRHLRNGRCISCGCWRADPDVRQAARLKTSPRRRREIARQGANARWKNE